MQKYHGGRMKKGFTLAEVLITLGIIGVVAAMTLPALINHYKKRETVEKLKTTYSLISNAMERAKADYGLDYKDWQGSTYKKDDFEFLYSTYFKPYLSTFDARKGQICVKYKCRKEYTVLNGGSFYQHEWSGSFRLKNGAFIHIHPYHCGIGIYSDALYIDVDGPEKGENKLGIDVFDYMLTIGRGDKTTNLRNGILTTPCEQFTREELLEKCSKTSNWTYCNTSGASSCCSTLIMHDGWEIKEDYPWK